MSIGLFLDLQRKREVYVNCTAGAGEVIQKFIGLLHYSRYIILLQC